MRSCTSPDQALKTLLGVMASCLSVGCGAPAGPLDAPADEPKGTAEVAPACVVPAPEGVSALVAHRDGVVFAVPSPTRRDPGLVVRRWRGAGCDLAADGSAPVAAGSLLDADDLGNLYVFPAEAHARGVISTMLPDEYPESMVAKVDAAGNVSKLLAAGRGIWDFGVSPEGGALWVTACGPTGIFSMTDDGVEQAAMTPPETLWQQMPSALTTDRTFWSVGVRTCVPPEAVTPACGFALVRSTPEGSREVGTTVVDLGAGFERATLARCGADVCGVFASAVIVWDDEGKALRTIRVSDLDAAPSERIAQVTGNQHGVYLLLRGDAGARVVFVAVRG
jgi:hypothetical protein